MTARRPTLPVSRLRGMVMYCYRRFNQNFRSKVAQLFVVLALISIVCIALQLFAAPHLNRCEQELDRFLLHPIPSSERAIISQERSSMGLQQEHLKQDKSRKLTLDPGNSEDEVYVMELSQQFIISDRLINQLDARHRPIKGSAKEESQAAWLLHTDNMLPITASDFNMKYTMDVSATSKASSLGNKIKREDAKYSKKEKEMIKKQKLVLQHQTLSKKIGHHSQDEKVAPLREFKTSDDAIMEASVKNHQRTHNGITKNFSDDDLKETDVRISDEESFLSSDPSSSPKKTCKPQTNIVFLKIHKSASSTVMNILFRYGEAHNLKFAFPRYGATQLYYPYHFMSEFVEGFTPGMEGQFNIMCHHMRFQLHEVAAVMPEDAFYFAILRNPVQLMESSFAYYKTTSAFILADTLEEFLAEPLRFYDADAKDSHYAKNIMTFDFGFNNNAAASFRYTQSNIMAIHTMFNLILIAEYFDESMILLKEALCWDINDVVSFPLNSRNDRTKLSLSEKVTEQIQNWNKLDWELYRFFNMTFWRKIDEGIGRERMKQEVAELRQRREELAQACLQGGSKVDPESIIDHSLAPFQYGIAAIQGYNLKAGLSRQTRQLCESLIRPELQYSSLLYDKQFPKKRNSFQNVKWPGKPNQNTYQGNRAMRRYERVRSMTRQIH